MLELEKIISYRKQAENSLQQKGFTGTPQEAFNKAIEELELWKKEWDKGGEKPKSREANNARRTINTLKPLLKSIEQNKNDIALKVVDSLDLKESRQDRNTLLTLAAIMAIDMYPPARPNPNTSTIIKCISDGFQTKGRVDFTMFSCPEVKAFWLTTKEPDLFIETQARINTGTADPRPINKLSKFLLAMDIPFKLNIIVGELDEENYIFPILGNFNTNPQIVTQRRKEYLENFISLCREKFPSAEIGICGWSGLANLGKDVNQEIPSLQFLNEEVARISTFFKPGGYYDGLPTPNTNQLEQIARLKMFTYARQGAVIKQTLPNAIYIQNEEPAFLRTLMLNSDLLAKKKEIIPTIYPYSPRQSIY